MAQTKKHQEQEINKYLQSASDALLLAIEKLALHQRTANDHKMHDQKDQNNKWGRKNDKKIPSIFDRVEDRLLDESVEHKVATFRLTQFTQKRKDEFFKRHRRDQEQKLISCKKKLQKHFDSRGGMVKLSRNEFTITNEQTNKTQTFPITYEDMQKLRPETDLNDTIIGNYIKMFNFVFMSQQFEQKSYFYSSFFIEKLIVEFGRDDVVYQKDTAWLINAIREKVNETYKNIKRWTRRVDIFQKQIVVFPINAYRHWFTVILHRPTALLAEKSAQKMEIIYCDSMFEKKEYIVAAIRRYLELQLQEKRGVRMELNQSNSPCYQLLLPRQTNTHDCGLYMISYIEELLTNKKNLQNLSNIKNRRKLNLFPRTLIYTMRDRLRKLFTKLINANDLEEKNNILAEYKGEKEQIMMDAEPDDYDSIDEKEYRKYEKMNLGQISGANEQERVFMCQIKFYLDTEVNFYQKDR